MKNIVIHCDAKLGEILIIRRYTSHQITLRLGDTDYLDGPWT